jgi:hypothetical protein
VPTDPALSQAVAQQAVEFGLKMTVATLVVVAVFVLARRTGLLSAGGGSTGGHSREPFRRHADFSTVVVEDDDEWGVALYDMNGSVELLRYDGDDRVYSQTHLHDSELAPVADELSALACQQIDEADRGDARDE